MESVLLDRRSWDRLSRGLIGYGLAALSVGLLWLGALLWVNTRIGGLRDDVQATVPRVTSTAELTAKALREGASTAASFRTRLQESAAALSSSAATITVVRADLSAFEGQLRSVSILGSRPLASPADAVGRIAASMDGLDSQLSRIADGLRMDQDTLAANAASLGELGASADRLAGSLAGSLAVTSIQGLFDDVQLILTLTLVLCAASAIMPAVSALWLGLGLRRQLGRPRAQPSAEGPEG